MSGTARVKPPRNDAEWARNTQKRLDQVENPASTRVGQWVLSTEADTGNLLASFVNGGSVVLAKAPEPGGNPDDVTGTEPFPSLKLKRTANQEIDNNTTVNVSWDTLDRNVGGWNATALPVETITVPEAGLYLVIFKLVFTASNAKFNKGVIQVNGTPVSSLEINPQSDNGYYQSYYLTEVLDLQTQDQILCSAFSVEGDTFGTSGLYAQNITTLTMQCLERRR